MVKDKTTSMRKFNESERAQLCKWITENKYKDVEAVLSFHGYEGVTAKFFEDMIKLDGLSNDWIKAIAVHFNHDLNLVEVIQNAKGGQ